MLKLEKQWMESCILKPGSITAVITAYAKKHFAEYVKYVGNQTYQERQLDELLQ